MPVPGQKFIEVAGSIVVKYAFEDVPKLGKGLHVNALCSFDERVESGGPFTT